MRRLWLLSLFLAVACETQAPNGAVFSSGGDDDGGDSGSDGGDDLGSDDSGGGDAGGDDMNGSDQCDDVTISFVGEMTTISGTPMGLSSDENRTDAISGTFSYRPCTSDMDTSAGRAEYDHGEAAPFTLVSEAIEITGSGRPLITILDSDTSTWFYYEDGPVFGDEKDRTISVDGVPNETLEIWIALGNSSESVLPDDSLPQDSWDFSADWPHTFSLSDEDGTLLLQLDSMARVED